MKSAEQTRRDVVHAAVNELRYAGRVVMDVWELSLDENSQGDTDKIDEKLTVAEQYLMNADHDITDGICLVLYQKMLDLLEHVPRRKLRRDFKDLDEFLERLDKANQIVTQSRETRADRKELYEQLEKEHIPYLLSKFDLLDYAERMAEVRIRRTRWFAVAGYLVGVIGLVGSFASIVSLDGQCSIVSNATGAIKGLVSTPAICEPTE
ncbi:MAG: hypothetical protein AAGA87_15920 [Pseudomonadota bacterium]